MAAVSASESAEQLCGVCGAVIAWGWSDSLQRSAWVADAGDGVGDGAACRRGPAGGHLPRQPAPVRQWHRSESGRWTPGTVVPGAAVGTERARVEALNAHHGREVCRLLPLDAPAPTDSSDEL